MRGIIKIILFFCFVLSSCYVSAQTDLEKYLAEENVRIAKADTIEKDVTLFISDNLPNYSLTQAKIDEITEDMLNVHDGTEDPITGAELEAVLLGAKKSELRKLYFETYPEKEAFFEPTPLPEALKQQCVNGGFEDGVANYTFRAFEVYPSTHLADGCSTNAGSSYTPTGLNQFQNRATLVSPGNEPLLAALNIFINRVRNGNRAIKLSPNPVTASTDGQNGNVTAMSRNFIINENQIDFSFLHIGSVVPVNSHTQPTFRYKLIDNVSNAELRSVCIRMNNGDCRYRQVPDTRPGWSGTIISYTPQWVCERINTADLIGRNVRLEFLVSDCEFRGHFSTVYLDDICGVTCEPTWGSINLNPVNINCPTEPFNICGTIAAGPGNTLQDIHVNVLNQSGSGVGSITNYTVTGNTFCCTVNPSVFGSNPAGNYYFQAVANITSTCGTKSVFDVKVGTVSFNNCCLPTLTLVSGTDNMTNNSANAVSWRERSDWIRASNIVNVGNANTGDGVVYHAGNFVELNPGFEAMSGSQFSAYIQGCTGGFVYKANNDVKFDYVIEEPKEDTTIHLVKNVNGKSRVSLYPNPTNNFLTVSYNIGFNQVRITSIDGKTVFNQKSDISNSKQIDVSNLKNGIYTLSIVTTEGATLTEKLIKN
jgi:hypothetical protein